MNIFKGKSVEEAIELGLKELSLTRETAKITVISEAEKGVLGFKSKKAEVKIEAKLSGEEKALKFLDGLFEIMNLPVLVENNLEGEKVLFNLVSTASSSLIGHRGEMLDAIQTLAGAVYNTDKEEYKRVIVDCENYRQKRNETLENLANKLADRAIKTGRKVMLEPMNPYERRIIHSALTNKEGIKTESVGEEPNRYIVIIPDNLKPYDKGYNKKDRFNKRGDKKSEVIKLDKKTSGFGTYLGNSLKDN